MTPLQFDFTSLNELCLRDHGDAIERFYSPKVASSLSEYEIFWKKFIVLLTNRVNPSLDKDWIMLRSGLSEKYESLLMANYATFHHCVVAHEQIEIGRKAKAECGFNHLELFFFSAKACLESLKVLQSKAGLLLSSRGIRPRFPQSPDDMIHAITFYRDVFAHRGHLGRGTQHGRDLIPALEHLPGSGKDPKSFWSYTMALPEREMTDALDLQAKLWSKLAGYLRGTWKALADAFEQYRLDPAFVHEVGLAAFLPIHAGIATTVMPSMVNPYAASGTIVYEKKKANLSPVPYDNPPRIRGLRH
jgi:hypothetical protein